MQGTSNFEQWAEGKHPLLAVLAHSQVTQAKMAYGVTKAVHEEDMFFKDLPAPDLDTWLRLFRSHPSGIAYATGIMGDPSGLVGIADEYFDQFGDNEPISKEDVSIADAENIFAHYLAALQTIDEQLEETVSPEVFEETVLSPEFYFFFRIYLPCWVNFYTTPAQLLRKARLRDFESLKKLIKLDRSAIFDRKVSRYIHELRSKNRSKYEQVLDTLYVKSKSQITRQKIKVFCAAIILNMSIEFGERLTEPEIRELFDAVARDDGKGDIDSDLPDSPHTLYMAMKRHIAASPK